MGDFIWNLVVGGLWGLWLGLPFEAQALIIVGILLLIGGFLFNIGSIAKAIAGWPGVAAIGLFLAAVVAAVASTRPRGTPIASRDPVAPKPPRRTWGGFRKRKRRYNPDTNEWVDVK